MKIFKPTQRMMIWDLNNRYVDDITAFFFRWIIQFRRTEGWYYDCIYLIVYVKSIFDVQFNPQ